jgi:hypothetical protein
MITAMKTSTMALCITFFLLITTAFAANGSQDSGEQNGSPEIGHRYGPKKNSQSNGSPPGGRVQDRPRRQLTPAARKTKAIKLNLKHPAAIPFPEPARKGLICSLPYRKVGLPDAAEINRTVVRDKNKNVLIR